ncbi:hypothetical protein ACKAMS_32135 [Rhodococcus sp. 5A-K4]|uniref:hypothetical protein n=1 Tax=Rhodococcus qingshengii TaxID=334542 RepID=UPI0027E25482|nr:hypothetical protein [Rhodococcus qingshengii]
MRRGSDAQRGRLGTAAGDWTLEITGWGPGVSVLLPAGLITLIVIGQRLGANTVLSFWLAYVLTRPLGANLGDWVASSSTDRGLGAGTALTSAIFLLAIVATVVYLTMTRRDVVTEPELPPPPTGTPHQGRERIMLGYYAAVAVAAAALLVWASAHPHETLVSDEETGTAPASTTLTPGQASAVFPSTDIANFRTITQNTLMKVQACDHTGAVARINDHLDSKILRSPYLKLYAQG